MRGPEDAREAAAAVRSLLADPDADVVASAAKACARMGDEAAVAPMEAALARADFVETKRDLAGALAALGSAVGVPVLLDGLDDPDDVLRATMAVALFEATGLYESYDPYGPRPERREAIARLWSSVGAVGVGAAQAGRSHRPRRARARHGRWSRRSAAAPTRTPAATTSSFWSTSSRWARRPCLPLVDGLTFPTGFARKRAIVCEALGRDRRPARRALPGACAARSRPHRRGRGPAGRSRRRATGRPSPRCAVGRVASRRSTERRRDGRSPRPVERLLARAAWVRGRLGDEPAAAEEARGGAADAGVASAPPSLATPR